MDKKQREIVYVDMDNVLVDFQSGIDTLSDEEKKEYEGRYDEVPGIFSKMKPMPNAVKGFKTLCMVYDVYILSTAPWNNPSAWSDKLCWVKDNLGEQAYKRLILSHHKELNDGDYLIDDSTKNGAKEFKGVLILFGSYYTPDWDSIVRFFLNMNK